MSATTLMNHTRQQAEETAVEQARQQVRVAIREVREYAYRALVVAGASPGEATTAAEQVLHAELHTGEGLTGLATALLTGLWPDASLTVTRDDADAVHLACGTLTSELRLSAALTDVAAGETGAAQVISPSTVDLTPLWDAALLSAAAATGSEVSAVRYGMRAPAVVRLATPEGDLLVARLPLGDEPVTSGSRVVARTGTRARPLGLAILSRSTAEERAARRREAAEFGLTVDAATWTVLADHAQQFLVPEVDA